MLRCGAVIILCGLLSIQHLFGAVAQSLQGIRESAAPLGDFGMSLRPGLGGLVMAANSRKGSTIARIVSILSRKDSSSVADSPLMDDMAEPISPLSSSTRLWHSSSVMEVSASFWASASSPEVLPQAVREKARQRRGVIVPSPASPCAYKSATCKCRRRTSSFESLLTDGIICAEGAEAFF